LLSTAGRSGFRPQCLYVIGRYLAPITHTSSVLASIVWTNLAIAP